MKVICRKNRIQVGKKDIFKLKGDIFVDSKIKLRVVFKIRFLSIHL